MSNNRIYYAIQQVGLKPESSGDVGAFKELHGIQSAGFSTNFNLEPISSLGEFAPYEHLENNFDIQINLSKVLDGYPLILTSATSDSVSPSILDRSFAKCYFGMSIFDDFLSSATGTPLGVLQCSGLYVNNIRYNFDTQNNFQEDIGFICNNKIWKNDWRIINSTNLDIANNLSFDGAFDNRGYTTGVGGVNRRQDFIFDLDTDVYVSEDVSIMPQDIIGINQFGQPTNAHIRNVNISANINREPVPELGSKTPSHRIITFPLEITTEIGVVALSGDGISATDIGIFTDSTNLCENLGNIYPQQIRVATCEGTRIYLGAFNKLAAVNYQGGDTGGGYVQLSYTYKTINDLNIIHKTETGFWENREPYLSLTGLTTYTTATGTFGFMSGVTITNNGLNIVYSGGVGSPTGTGFFNATSGGHYIYRSLFNWQLEKTKINITGFILEAKAQQVNGTSVTNPRYIQTYTGSVLSTTTGIMLLGIAEPEIDGSMSAASISRLFPSGISSTTTEYYWRIRGIGLYNIVTSPTNSIYFKYGTGPQSIDF